LKKFLIKITVFTLLIFLVDKSFYWVKNLSAQKEIDKRLEKIINGELESDILIFGSSRGARNIIASQIEDSLGVSTFNLSYPGSDITFHEYLLRKVIERGNKIPKTVILAVDAGTQLKKDESITFRYDRLYPLVKYDDVLETLIERGEKNKWMSKLFILHQLSKVNFDLRQKNFTALDSMLTCGSMPITSQKENFKTRTFKISENSYSNSNEIEEKISAMNNFEKLCRKNNIQLVVAFSPIFSTFNETYSNRIEQLYDGKNVNFMYYDFSNKSYLDNKYFHDYTHLTKSGAVIFTNDLIKYLKNNVLYLVNI
jgi:hypothetical protein